MLRLLIILDNAIIVYSSPCYFVSICKAFYQATSVTNKCCFILALKTRLDYFIEHQSIDVDENAISFDACDSNDGAILMSVGDGLSKSSVYKTQQTSIKFIAFGEVVNN